MAIQPHGIATPLFNSPRRIKWRPVPSDVIRPIAFNFGPALARIVALPGGWTIDCRGSHAAQAHRFRCEGCAAEFARALRDEGGWSLRFGPGCDAVAAAVADLDEAAAV